MLGNDGDALINGPFLTLALRFRQERGKQDGGELVKNQNGIARQVNCVVIKRERGGVSGRSSTVKPISFLQ